MPAIGTVDIDIRFDPNATPEERARAWCEAFPGAIYTVELAIQMAVANCTPSRNLITGGTTWSQGYLEGIEQDQILIDDCPLFTQYPTRVSEVIE